MNARDADAASVLRTLKIAAPQIGLPRLAALRPNAPRDENWNYLSDAVLNVAVETNTTALPSNFSQIMPRCGSFENVVITVVVGFCRYGPRLRKSVAPSRVVFM